jgi:Uma2 family endonuclease
MMSDFHYELVDGKLELMNPPTIEHFLIVDSLDTAFKAEIKRCSSPWLCFRESGVRTGRNKSRLTDLCVVTVEQARELLNASAVFSVTAVTNCRGGQSRVGETGLSP